MHYMPFWKQVFDCAQWVNPTATLLEHTLLTQGFMDTSKIACLGHLPLQNRDSTWANLVSTLK